MTQITQWHGCYDGNLKDLIVPEAFKHPAKMSRKLCERIFDHGYEKGYWQPGDLIIDPFGGIGTTGIIGAYRGYKVISIELEDVFYTLALQNREKNQQKIERLGHPTPVFINGDSRKLLEILGQANGCVTSPPYVSGGHHPDQTGAWGGQAQALTKEQAGYGKTKGQLGQMKEGDRQAVTGAITSPPWEDNVADGGWQLLGKYAEEGRLTVDQVKGNPQKSYPSWSKDRDTSYGETEGQLGKMPRGDLPQVAGSITSPPYENSLVGQKPGEGKISTDRRAERLEAAGYDAKKILTPGRRAHGNLGEIEHYSDNLNNLGNQSGDTYWSAVALIYQQVFHLLPPGGAFAVVIKDFVRNKKRVSLCNQTAELLETIGFDIPERIHAMLIKEIAQTEDMFTGKSDPKLIKRQSFFRRLAEKKGAPPIDWEEVIWAVKP